MAWAPGERLGPYTIDALIGHGSMGEVYRAQDSRLHRRVAVKRILAGASQRFLTEARTIDALNHPHICQIFDVGPDYLVLEYVGGRRSEDRSPPTKRCACRSRSPTRWQRRMPGASSIAI